jgi:hypothetical protein
MSIFNSPSNIINLNSLKLVDPSYYYLGTASLVRTSVVDMNFAIGFGTQYTINLIRLQL